MDSIALFYLSKLETIRKVAREHGYAVGLHGSMSRDFDLIAAPWTADAKPPRELAEAVRVATAGHWNEHESDDYHMNGSPGWKPHGRLCWTIHFGVGAYLDLSVMPRGFPPHMLTLNVGEHEKNLHVSGDIRLRVWRDKLFLVRAKDDKEQGETIAEFTKSEFASLVCDVSPKGEEGGRFAYIFDFLQNGAVRCAGCGNAIKDGEAAGSLSIINAPVCMACYERKFKLFFDHARKDAA